MTIMKQCKYCYVRTTLLCQSYLRAVATPSAHDATRMDTSARVRFHNDDYVDKTYEYIPNLSAVP